MSNFWNEIYTRYPLHKHTIRNVAAIICIFKKSRLDLHTLTKSAICNDSLQ